MASSKAHLLTKSILLDATKRHHNVTSIATELGCSSNVVQKYLKKHKINFTRRSKKFIPGYRFGKLTIIEKRHKDIYLCRCDCGNEILVQRCNMRDTRQKSCGCLRNAQRLRNRTEKYYEDFVVTGKHIYQIKYKAKKCNKEFDESIMTPEYLYKLYLQQDKKCALSGLPIVIKKYNQKQDGYIASLDRIDSSKGYVKDNIQWVIKEINVMKNNMPETKFINLCMEICKNANIHI